SCQRRWGPAGRRSGPLQPRGKRLRSRAGPCNSWPGCERSNEPWSMGLRVRGGLLVLAILGRIAALLLVAVLQFFFGFGRDHQAHPLASLAAGVDAFGVEVVLHPGALESVALVFYMG